jgi:inosine-uridine nucleoside N-ribohydrolase
MTKNWIFLILMALAAPAWAQQRRKVIIDQDCAGPGGSNLQAVMVMVQSPEVEPLGITVASGDQWRDEEVAHTLRLLEIVGRTGISVLPGAVFPLVHTRDEALAMGRSFGKIAYMGAWDPRFWHAPFEVPPLVEGMPSAAPSSEDAAHFMVRMVHMYPHQVTLYSGAPLTNIALAIRLDPHFAELAQELVFMGGSLNPQSTDAEWANDPRHEFNFWFDAEAAHIVLTADWAKVTCTPVDISIKTHFAPAMVDEIAKSGTPLALYLRKYYLARIDYMWDELAAAAWLDPSIITHEQLLYMDVNINHGPGYGDTLTWSDRDKPEGAGRPVHVQTDLDAQKFYREFIELMKRK